MIDPGPDLPEHLDALEQAIDGRRVAAIMCTHTHRDHSPAARPLAERTAAPIIGCAPLALETVGPRADASFDGDYAPDRVLADGDTLQVGGDAVTAVATPGHTSNHLCFAYRGALFSGRSCDGLVDHGRGPAGRRYGGVHAEPDKLRERDDRIYYPAHGPAVTTRSNMCATWSATGCSARSRSCTLVGEQSAAIPDIVAKAYPGLDPRL